MKGYCLLFFLTCVLLAAGQKKAGVVFFDGTLALAKEKAKSENKMIFLDCYTSWCGPCRYMAEKVFTTPEIGEFMNPLFVCVKMDMEKGEGPEWAKQLKIEAYPTFILFTPEGREQHRIIGGSGPEEFMSKVKEGVDLRTSASYKDFRYQQGERSAEFLQDYLSQLYEFRRDSVAKIVVTELYRSTPDSVLQSEAYWWLFVSKDICPFGSESFDYLMQHQDKFIQNQGDTVNRLILQKVENTIGTYIGWYPLKGDYEQQYYKTVCRLDDFVKEKLTEHPELKAETELLKARFCGDFEKYRMVFQKNIWLIPNQNIPNAYSGLAFCALKTGDQAKIEQITDLGEDLKTKLTDIRLQAIMDRIFVKIKEK